MSINQTRSCINSILDGSINNTVLRKDDIFNFQVPLFLENVHENVCNPRDSWENKTDYDNKAIELAMMFQDNYLQYTGEGITDYSKYGPIIPSKI